MSVRPWFGLAFLAVPCVALLSLTMAEPERGVVVDAAGLVVGATVGIQGERARVCSAGRGEFQLPSSGRGKRIVASKPGYRIASAPLGAGRLFLEPLLREDNDDYAWIDPGPDPLRPRQCGNCHEAIHDEWAASAHAGSARNPRFLELFAGGDRGAATWNILAEYPDGAGVCASCHAPTLHSPTLDYDVRRAEGVAARGVHCDYCHKVAEAPLDKLGTRFGKDGLVLLRPAGDDQLFFGPLDDAVRRGESFAHAPVYKDSGYCASCHEGILFGVHVYGTYSEWLASPARKKGQQCQTCHMTPTGTLTNIAPGKGGIERDPFTLASHALPGGTLEMLRRCLTLDVATRTTDKALEVEVTLRAHDVGHRVPTGFIDRHLLLVVEASEPAGQPSSLLRGERLGMAAGKRYRDLAGRIFAKTVVDEAGSGPLPFWKPHDAVVDTRLTPEQIERRTFTFAGSAANVRVRLLYRRLWPAVAESRGREAEEIVVFDRTVSQR